MKYDAIISILHSIWPLMGEHQGVLIFEFTDAGPIPDDYWVSEEFNLEAGQLFTEGFNAWVAAGTLEGTA